MPLEDHEIQALCDRMDKAIVDTDWMQVTVIRDEMRSRAPRRLVLSAETGRFAAMLQGDPRLAALSEHAAAEPAQEAAPAADVEKLKVEDHIEGEVVKPHRKKRVVEE